MAHDIKNIKVVLKGQNKCCYTKCETDQPGKLHIKTAWLGMTLKDT